MHLCLFSFFFSPFFCLILHHVTPAPPLSYNREDLGPRLGHRTFVVLTLTHTHTYRETWEPSPCLACL
jgi:hypothetical protein